MTGKRAPQNFEAERKLIAGAWLGGHEAVDTAAALIGPADFYGAAHRAIWEALLRLHEQSAPIERVALVHELERRGVLSAVGGAAALEEIECAFGAGGVEYYAKLVRKVARRRRCLEAAMLIANKACDEKVDDEELVDEFERVAFEVRVGAGAAPASEFVSLRRVIKDGFKALEQRHERFRAGAEMTGVPSGLRQLDLMTQGFQPGDFIVVGARPSMGKTAATFGWAVHAATHHKRDGKRCAVAMFSLEQPKEQLADRAFASEGRIDLSRIRLGDMLDADWGKLAKAAGEIANSPLFIADRCGMSVQEIRAACRRLKRDLASRGDPECGLKPGEVELGLVAIDYLQLIKPPPIENREQQVAEISRALKGLAKELGAPVVALSQLNRSLDKRPDKRPVMSDLRDSGSIEQDADLVVFLYRDEVYSPADEPGLQEKERERRQREQGVAELIVAKQRNGGLGTARVAFLHPFTRFENIVQGFPATRRASRDWTEAGPHTVEE